MPNRFLGIVGKHDGFPIQNLCLSSDGNVCASISHDENVKFWNVENIKDIKISERGLTNIDALKDVTTINYLQLNNNYLENVDGLKATI